jgi:hypothetical protein
VLVRYGAGAPKSVYMFKKKSCQNMCICMSGQQCELCGSCVRFYEATLIEWLVGKYIVDADN